MQIIPSEAYRRLSFADQYIIYSILLNLHKTKGMIGYRIINHARLFKSKLKEATDDLKKINNSKKLFLFMISLVPKWKRMGRAMYFFYLKACKDSLNSDIVIMLKKFIQCYISSVFNVVETNHINEFRLWKNTYI